MEDLNTEELTLLTAVIDEDEPHNSLQSVSHDPAKERSAAKLVSDHCMLVGMECTCTAWYQNHERSLEVRLWLG